MKSFQYYSIDIFKLLLDSVDVSSDHGVVPDTSVPSDDDLAD